MSDPTIWRQCHLGVGSTCEQLLARNQLRGGLVRSRALVPTALTVLTACWHATVETGLTPSTVVIDRSWAASWIYGLVPPKTVETASRCPDGVAKVETELTFLNQVVHLLTLGIYTPMRIRVTCAQASTASPGTTAGSPRLPIRPGEKTVQSVFQDAAELAFQQRHPVLVYFEQDGSRRPNIE
jgi:Bor protein